MALTEASWGHKSTPTFDFDGGVGGRAAVEGVNAHVDAGVVSSGLFHTAEHKEIKYALHEPAHSIIHTLTHVWRAHTLVLSVFILAARFRDLLSVLHPEALVVAAVGACQVALQREGIVHWQRGVLRRADGRLC